MYRRTKALLMALTCVAMAGMVAAAGPVARVTQVEGELESSRDGSEWRTVARTTYLFSGQHLRSGEDGSALVVNQLSGDVHELGPGTELVMEDEAIALRQGDNFGLQEADDSGVWQSLRNRFASSQRYTTVRRAVRTQEDHPRVDIARTLAVAESWPEIVWSNAGPDYSYRLQVGSKSFEVQPSSTSEFIRFELPEMEPGEYEYTLKLLHDGEVVREPRRPSRLIWIGDEQVEDIRAQLAEIRANPVHDDPFVVADLYESQDLLVPALDQYREFFAAHPEANAMRPFLIKAYHELRLLDLREKEAITYNTIEMMEQAL